MAGPSSRPASIADGCDALPHHRSAIPRHQNKAGLCRRGVTERGDDLIDDVLDQDAVVALANHTDHGLGAGRTEQQPAVAVEEILDIHDLRFPRSMVERITATMCATYS